MNIDPEVLNRSLVIAGLGMTGVFCVLAVIMAAVMILNRITVSKKRMKRKPGKE